MAIMPRCTWWALLLICMLLVTGCSVEAKEKSNKWRPKSNRYRQNAKSHTSKIEREAVSKSSDVGTQDSAEKLNIVKSVLHNVAKYTPHAGAMAVITYSALNYRRIFNFVHNKFSKTAPRSNKTEKKTSNNDIVEPTVDKSGSIGSVASTTPIKELLNGIETVNKEVLNSSDIDDETFICLLFDCEQELTNPADIKARKDYFTLMHNITCGSNVENIKLRTIYVPGKGNSHIISGKGSSFKPDDWYYVTSNNMKYAQAIREKYGVKNEELRIIILGKGQKVISENALDLLRISPKGLPWPQKNINTVVGNEFLAGNGLNSTVTLGDKDVIGLYFSASWCKPCVSFTPKLISAYSNITGITNAANTGESGNNSKMEILLVSLDQDEGSFNEYRTKMPWPVYAFKDLRRGLLQIGLGIKSIPALVFINKEGQVLTSSGVTEVMNDENFINFPWKNSILDLTSGAAVEKLQRNPAIIVFSENCDESTKALIKENLTTLSNKYDQPLMMPRSPRDDLMFCYVDTEGKLADTLRDLCHLKAASSSLKNNSPQVVILDLVQEHCSVLQLKSNDFTTEMDKFVQLYKNYDVKITNLKLPKQE